MLKRQNFEYGTYTAMSKARYGFLMKFEKLVFLCVLRNLIIWNDVANFFVIIINLIDIEKEFI